MVEDPPTCPVCADRHRSPESIHIGAYLFALLCAGFLAYQTWSHDRRGETVPSSMWMPLTVLTGVALGVRIDANRLAQLLGGSRNA